MGRLERKIERAIMSGLFRLLVWLLLAPFKLLKWIFTAGRKPSKYINSNGYVVLTESNELEHRHIAKQQMGRDLYSNEVVHHINGKKTDNWVNNLCLMDGEKHEHFHAWLRWKKEKTKRYPTIKKQKQVLESEYSGTLLEKVTPPSPKVEPKKKVIQEESETIVNETYMARRNKASQKLFIEFEEEVLIGPNGKVIEIDQDRFDDLEEVTQSGLTETQLEVYNNRLKNQESEDKSKSHWASIQKELFAELKKERLKIAKEIKLPPYYVFHDSTLIEMTKVMPGSEALMLSIKGGWPRKDGEVWPSLH